MMTAQPMEGDAYYDLYHCTEPWQEETVRIYREIWAGTEALQRACLERFGQIPDAFNRPLVPVDTIEITESRDGYARLECMGGKRLYPETLVLVRIDGEWRIDAGETIIAAGGPLPAEYREASLAGVRTMRRNNEAQAERIRNGEVPWDRASDGRTP